MGGRSMVSVGVCGGRGHGLVWLGCGVGVMSSLNHRLEPFDMAVGAFVTATPPTSSHFHSFFFGGFFFVLAIFVLCRASRATAGPCVCGKSCRKRLQEEEESVEQS